MTYLDFAKRGKNAGWRYVVGFGLALILFVVFVVLIAIPAQLARLIPADLAQQVQHATRPSLFFLSNGAVFGLLLLAFIAAIALVQRKRPVDVVGLWRWRAFLLGGGLWLTALILSSLIDLALSPHGFSVSAHGDITGLALWALIGLSVQTFTEEFIFRGWITQGLLLGLRRPWLTAVLSGLLFGAAHIPNGGPQAANAVLFGVVLSLIAIRTGGLAFGFGVHLINNLYGAVVVVSADDVFRGSPGLFTQHTAGLMWWDAGVGGAALVLMAALTLNKRLLAMTQAPSDAV